MIDELILKASPRPWRVSEELGHKGIPGEPDEPGYIEGVIDAENNWVFRFDDDYGTDQSANAALIVALVNATVGSQVINAKGSGE